MTLTTSAASSGSSPQPLIRSSTVRNSAAAIAPDKSASATGPSRPKRVPDARAPRRARRGSGASTPGTAIRAAGAWIRKIERQPKACVSAPPIAGPAAVPSRAA